MFLLHMLNNYLLLFLQLMLYIFLLHMLFDLFLLYNSIRQDTLYMPLLEYLLLSPHFLLFQLDTLF